MSSKSRSRSRDRSAERTQTSKKIYISNLSPDTSELELRNKFEEFGPIDRVDIKKKGEDITFAFIEYTNAKDADKAIDALHRTEFQNRTLKVEFAKGGNGRFDRGGFGGRGMRGDRGGYGGGFRGRGEGRFGGGSYGDRPPRSDVECFNCRGTGHFAKDCPKPREFNNRRGGDRDRPRYDRDERDDRDTRDRRRRSRSRSSRSSSGGDRRRNTRENY